VCHEMQDAIGYAIRYWLADAKFFKDSITKQSDCPNYREVCTGTGECVCEICACPRFRCPMKEPEIKNGK
jgi:ferric iron reductase protein FhuF